MPKEVAKEEIVDAKVVKQETMLTKEEVERDYVSRADYDTLNANYQKVINAFNKLMDEYNQLHVQSLLNEAK